LTAASDDLRRAYSTLGLEPGATPARARRRYRELAKRWHPDRHAADPRSEAEAALQMRAINAAYDVILTHLPAARPAAGAAPGLPRTRLSREEIERYVGTIGSHGPIDFAIEIGRSLRRPYLIWMAGVAALAAGSRWLELPPPTIAPMAALLLVAILVVHSRS
jgi:curved DNA-binding protein CbpA